jgi:hypothetical protein
MCVALGLGVAVPVPGSAQKPPARNYPYRELEGKVEEFAFNRNWRSYYWREDHTLLVRDADGMLHRVISREPTPWVGYRLGTTYTGLTVDWTSRPRVRIIGVGAIDRIPAEFYGLKLDPDKTLTSFITRVQMQQNGKPVWRDFYVNNWFHSWGTETDKKMLQHYANDDPNYTVYGYLGGIAAPIDAAGMALLAKYPDGYIYHGRVVTANNDAGYELRLLHLLGRDKKTAKYEVFHGDPASLVKLDGNAPPEAKKK